MKKNKKNRVNKLKVNLAYMTLMLSTATFAIAGYNTLNKNSNKETTKESNSIKINNISFDLNKISITDSNVMALLKEETNTYSGMNLTHEYEEYIKELCINYADEYNLDSDELFKNVLVIGDQESDGKWNNNGVVSPTEDYGVFQINIVNHKKIEEKLGYTTEELLNDQYKNADAAVWIIANIMVNDYCKNDADIYGMYNGWINWENYDSSVEYVDNCLARNDMYFASGVLEK